MFRYLKIIALALILAAPVFSQETSDVDVLPDLSSESSKAILNDQLRRSNRRLIQLEGADLSTWETPTADGVLVGDGSGFSTKVLPSCSNGTLAYNSTTDAFSCVSLTHVQIYTTGTGNWTAPTGVTKVYITALGGGGGGGGGSNNGTHSGGGGGGAGFVINKPYTVVAGNSYAYAVGAGGAGGGNETNGTTGGNTTFDSTGIIALGGGGGVAGTNAVGGPGTGGVGGGGYDASGTTAGAQNFKGGNGGSATDVGPDSGAGGGTPWGVGGAKDGGSAAANSGGGGGGNDTGGTGGTGGSGLLIIIY